MILTGKEIEQRLGKSIVITPYDAKCLNPNSYNLKLHDEVLVYTEDVLDPKKDNATRSIVIPKAGLIIEPGQLYLARTHEYTETHGLVPMIIGRSSTGRLGITVHVTSGFGDIGFCGYWTLQLTCTKRVRIYPQMEICQIFYHSVLGEYEDYSSAKYQNSGSAMPCQLYKEFKYD